MKSVLRTVLLGVCSVMWSSSLLASSVLWRDVSASSLSREAQLSSPPAKYRLVALDTAAFHSLAASAPLENVHTDRSAAVITLPMPDGSFADFWLRESPIIDAALAAVLPEVKTYTAQGIDDPAATARLDWTPAGFHALVLSPSGNVYIDPYAAGDSEHYISYLQSDAVADDERRAFTCNLHGRKEAPRTTANSTAGRMSPSAITIGPVLRTYRLAVAATGEYTAYYGGYPVSAQAAIVTTMNRVTAIYEREIGVRLTLVNNSAIVYANAATDPFTNTDADLDIVQSTIDSLIGDANYDIGHLVGTGGGGVAYLGVVCYPGYKAQGLTGSSRPIGDAFDVDYVAHEIGHQFGADHSFNGTTGACGGGNRWYNEAYEPGSGSTIMGYAGICGSENLQAHSDPYFHAVSFDAITSFVAGTYCGNQSSTGNSPPTVSAGPSIVIPKSTPFYLTGSAADPNGDTLTYAWEQFDLGPQSPPNTDDGFRPIFRSFNPVTVPTRTFPRLSNVFSGIASLGESLPTTNRYMTFRLTVRDNRAGGGAVSSATRTVAVSAAAGPFTVTSPTVAWPVGSGQMVTWNVAGTNASPVNCANVKILLTHESANPTNTTLVASTPNSGSCAVTVPDRPMTAARLQVECITSPFFNVSPGSFSIVSAMNITATAATATSVNVSWAPYSGASSYDVYRRSAGTDYVKVGSTSNTAYTDSSAAPNTAYLYKSYAKNSSGTVLTISNPDLATTLVFDDPLLTARVTPLKAAHITQLRAAVNAVRTLAAAGAATFTDAELLSGQTSCKAAHITELRTALDAARLALSLPPISYAEETITSRTTAITAAHVMELRAGVN